MVHYSKWILKYDLNFCDTSKLRMESIMRQAIHDYETNGWASDGYLTSWWNDYWSLVELTHMPGQVVQYAPDRMQALDCIKRLKAILEYKKYNS